MERKKRILVTGAAGTVGTAVLDILCAQSERYEISAFEADTKRAHRRLRKYADKIHCYYGDISCESDIREVCRDRDAVLHFAAVIPPLADKDPALAQRVNVRGTANLIAAVEKYASSAFFLYASSISVYGDRLQDPFIRVGDALSCSEGDAYAGTKIAAEAIVRGASADWSIFRLTAVMGVGNHKISKLMFHMPLKTHLEIITPEDCARAFVYALDHRTSLSRRIFNLGGGPQCRIEYRDFLRRSFQHFGLGKIDFPPGAFAGRNFHCGYYADGEHLEEILHFRRECVDSYFGRVKCSVSALRRMSTRLLSHIIKHALLRRSEPYMAVRRKDLALMRRFFGECPDRRIPA